MYYVQVIRARTQYTTGVRPVHFVFKERASLEIKVSMVIAVKNDIACNDSNSTSHDKTM